jgi:hypothetical protein
MPCKYRNADGKGGTGHIAIMHRRANSYKVKCGAQLLLNKFKAFIYKMQEFFNYSGAGITQTPNTKVPIH